MHYLIILLFETCMSGAYWAVLKELEVFHHNEAPFGGVHGLGFRYEGLGLSSCQNYGYLFGRYPE